MPHCAEEKTGLFTHGLQKGEELLCKGRTSCQDGGTNTHVLLPHPLTERTEGIHNKKRSTTGLKTKDPREKTQPGTRMVEGVTTETQHHPQGRSEI